MQCRLGMSLSTRIIIYFVGLESNNSISKYHIVQEEEFETSSSRNFLTFLLKPYIFIVIKP